jgi:hypothetical protein
MPFARSLFELGHDERRRMSTASIPIWEGGRSTRTALAASTVFCRAKQAVGASLLLKVTPSVIQVSSLALIYLD